MLELNFHPKVLVSLKFLPQRSEVTLEFGESTNKENAIEVHLCQYDSKYLDTASNSEITVHEPNSPLRSISHKYSPTSSYKYQRNLSCSVEHTWQCSSSNVSDLIIKLDNRSLASRFEIYETTFYRVFPRKQKFF